MKIEWSETALGRVDEIVHFIAADDPEAVTRWATELFTAVERSLISRGVVGSFRRSTIRRFARSCTVRTACSISLAIPCRSSQCVIRVSCSGRMRPSLDKRGRPATGSTDSLHPYPDSTGALEDSGVLRTIAFRAKVKI